ncbi:MAG: MBL fold metallo-hydrolase [Bacteroidales bacterium]
MKRITFVLLVFMPLLAISQRDWSQVEIPVTEIAPGVHRLFVANSVAVVMFHGTDGVLVVDAAYEQSADRLLEEIRKIDSRPITYLINTHLHGDHTGGNVLLGKEAQIIAHPSVKDALSQEQRRGDNIIPPMPEHAIPQIFVDDNMDLEFNGEVIQITHLPGGHTRGDLIVYLPYAGVLVMGDLLFAGYFPFVDVSNGGNPIVFLENVARVLAHFPAETIVVGGHGPVFSMDDLRNWHQQLNNTLEVMKLAKQNGMTAEQMKTARVLKDWEAMGSFFITEDRWIDTLYPFL